MIEQPNTPEVHIWHGGMKNLLTDEIYNKIKLGVRSMLSAQGITEVDFYKRISIWEKSPFEAAFGSSLDNASDTSAKTKRANTIFESLGKSNGLEQIFDQCSNLVEHGTIGASFYDAGMSVENRRAIHELITKALEDALTDTTMAGTKVNKTSTASSFAENPNATTNWGWQLA